MNKAVFLDRDGVINPLVYHCATGAFESPHTPDDFSLYPYTERSLRALKEAGYLNIVVSNQPSFAKGKTSLENIHAIEQLLADFSDEHGGLITKAYYCYHHPKGIVPQYTCTCGCRKPGTLFLEQAADIYGLDAAACWFIGDRDSDILCGKRFGCRTIRIKHPDPIGCSSRDVADIYLEPDGDCCADYVVPNLEQAVNQILNKNLSDMGGRRKNDLH